MTSNKTPNLSICLAVHREGLLAHKTLKSLSRALAELDRQKITYEVLAHQDNCDEATVDYFESQKLVDIKIFKNSFKDLSKSRNFLTKEAKGKYLTVLDADDLISREWLIEAYKYLEENGGSAIVHPKYSINFGTHNILWVKNDSLDIDSERLINVDQNRWDSVVMAKREVFDKYPYKPNEDGFGSEDWHFNCSTIADGLKHIALDKTALFVRRKDPNLPSEMRRQSGFSSTVRYSDLLELSKVKQLNTPSTEVESNTPLFREFTKDFNKLEVVARKAVYKSIKLARTTKVGSRTIAVLKNAKDGPIQDKPEISHEVGVRHPKIPDWLHEEWTELHTIEKLLFPSGANVSDMVEYSTDRITVKGVVFKEIADKVKANTIDHLIFVPWLEKGGADLTAIRYANELANIYPEKSIAVFSTQKSSNPWAGKLSDKVSFVNLYEISKPFKDNREVMSVLARFIVQAKVKSIQIINSELGYWFIDEYRELLKGNAINVYSAAYCRDISPEGEQVGYIHQYLPQTYDVHTKIFSDNQNTINELVEEYGYDPNKFSVHYQPVDSTKISWDSKIGSKSNKILWASRISLQKHPELVVEVAKKLLVSHPELTIEAYGSTTSNYRNVIQDAGLKNLKYMGNFDGFYNLPINDYFVYLYTSKYDGIPNIILEAQNVGMPTISSDVGGISEVIKDGSNGILGRNSPDDIVKSMLKIKTMKGEQLSAWQEKSKEVLHKKHTASSYKNKIIEDIKI